MISNNAGQRGDDGQKDIHGIMLYLNGRPYTNEGYRHGVSETIKSKDSIFMDLSDFCKNDGERFDFERYKITDVWIGGGSDGYEFTEFSLK